MAGFATDDLTMRLGLIFAQLEDAARAKDSPLWRERYRDALGFLFSLASRGERDPLVSARGGLERVRRRLDDDGPFPDEFTSDLVGLRDALTGALTMIDRRSHVMRSSQAYVGVRERVLQEVIASALPVQNFELADRLELDRTQVSRSLRELVSQGKVRQVGTASAEGDRRGRLYAATENAPEWGFESSLEALLGTANSARAIMVFSGRPSENRFWLRRADGADKDTISQCSQRLIGYSGLLDEFLECTNVDQPSDAALRFGKLA